VRRNFLISILVALVVTGIANAGAIKTWTTETLRYSDLNTTFQHIHDNLRGGTHTLIVNADLSASAAVAHSKLATPALLPKAFGTVAPDCSASPCTLTINSGFTSITRTGAGEYTGTLSSARANTTYTATVTPFDTAGLRGCRMTSVTSTTVFTFSCYDAAAAVDTGFTVLVWDNDN
jgi:hypothetical protein